MERGAGWARPDVKGSDAARAIRGEHKQTVQTTQRSVTDRFDPQIVGIC